MLIISDAKIFRKNVRTSSPTCVIFRRAVDPHQKHADPDTGPDEHTDPNPGNNNWLTQNLKNISKFEY